MGLPARRGLSPGRLPFRHCRVWSAWLDSNQRPHPSEGCALPGCATRCNPETGGQGRNRTSTDYAGRLQRLGLTNAQPARRAAKACGAGNPCHGRPEEAAMARGLSLIRTCRLSERCQRCQRAFTWAFRPAEPRAGTRKRKQGEAPVGVGQRGLLLVPRILRDSYGPI